MADNMVQPYTGSQTLDIAAIAAQLVDLAPGGMRGLRRELAGLNEVVSELQSSVPALGPKAGISSDVYADFEKIHALIGKIREARLVVDKMAEVLAESDAYYTDQREVAISLITAVVRTSARQRDASIRAAFEKTLAYNSQIAMKAVKTRRKNAEAAKGSESGGSEESQVPAGGAPAGGSPGGAPQASPP